VGCSSTHSFEGPGPALLFAHAASMCGGVWEPMLARVQPAAIVAYDLRGHGDSGAPVGSDAYRWSEIAQDFAEVVRWAVARLGRPIDLCVTHSFSGDCALLACATDTLPIERLLLLDPVAVDQNGAAIGGPALAEATRRAGTREVGGFDTAEAAAQAMERWIRPQLVEDRIDERARAAFATWGVGQDADGKCRFKCRRENEAEIYQNRLAIAAALETLSTVSQEVEVVFAEKRRVRPNEDPDEVRARDLEQVGALLSRCRRGTRTDLPKVGHFLALEAPDAVAALVATRIEQR
jgi:pimeloyl-ACP methyl ester carboxylesterase